MKAKIGAKFVLTLKSVFLSWTFSSIFSLTNHSTITNYTSIKTRDKIQSIYTKIVMIGVILSTYDAVKVVKTTDFYQ